MGTLTTRDGTQWFFLRYNDKIAYGHGDFAIHFVYETGLYHIKESGETIFVAKSALECLVAAPEYILDNAARKFIPCWEN